MIILKGESEVEDEKSVQNGHFVSLAEFLR